MERFVRFLFMIVLIPIGCVSASERVEVDKLRELLRLDPNLEATKTLKTSPYFIELRVGYYIVPGVLYNYDYCYSKFAKLKLINAGSDLIESESLAKLIHSAKSYAKKFNKIVAKGLDGRGQTLCKEGVNWTKVITDISDALSDKGYSEPTEIDGKAAPLIILGKYKEEPTVVAINICKVLIANGFSKKFANVAVDMEGFRYDFRCQALLTNQ